MARKKRKLIKQLTPEQQADKIRAKSLKAVLKRGPEGQRKYLKRKDAEYKRYRQRVFGEPPSERSARASRQKRDSKGRFAR